MATPRRTPLNYWTGGARPDEPETGSTVAPTLDLGTFETSGPERPVGFGRKCAWLAVRARESSRLLEALGVERSKPCGWMAGVATAYAKRQVLFVTPPIDGWTLAVAPNVTFYDEGDDPRSAHIAFVRKLAEDFGEAQYFSSHDGVALGAWTRVVSGHVTRSCLYSEGSRWSVGEADEAERAAKGRPAEEAVFAIAAHWSVDPLTLDGIELSPSQGMLGVLEGVVANPYQPSPYQLRYEEEIVPAGGEPLACNLYWDYRRLRYVFESLVETADGRRHVGPRKAIEIQDGAGTQRLGAALRTTFNRFARADTPPVTKRLPRREHCVLVEVEYARGRITFHPTRRRLARVRRVVGAAAHCEWDDRAGIVARTLDEAIIRAMTARPLLTRLLEMGGG